MLNKLKARACKAISPPTHLPGNYITSLHTTYHTREKGTVTRLLDSLNWPSSEAKRKCRRQQLLNESVHGSAVLPIPSNSNVPAHTNNIRSQASFINTTSKGNIYANSFFPRSIKDWDALPLDITKIETMDIFKRTVRGQMLFI